MLKLSLAWQPPWPDVVAQDGHEGDTAAAAEMKDLFEELLRLELADKPAIEAMQQHISSGGFDMVHYQRIWAPRITAEIHRVQDAAAAAAAAEAEELQLPVRVRSLAGNFVWLTGGHEGRMPGAVGSAGFGEAGLVDSPSASCLRKLCCPLLPSAVLSPPAPCCLCCPVGPRSLRLLPLCATLPAVPRWAPFRGSQCRHRQWVTRFERQNPKDGTCSGCSGGPPRSWGRDLS